MEMILVGYIHNSHRGEAGEFWGGEAGDFEGGKLESLRGGSWRVWGGRRGISYFERTPFLSCAGNAPPPKITCNSIHKKMASLPTWKQWRRSCLHQVW